MDAERWKRIEEIFHQALERSPDERHAFLKEICRADLSLHQEVESLLAQEGSKGSIEGAIGKAAEAFATNADADFSGDRIGPYRLTRLIGQGGMGAVYQAVRDDQEYSKQVAIKLIKRGMDTDLILQRFRHERQILATLEHSYIARLLDGGSTEDGLPFLVMEYIDGRAVTHYCDENKLVIRDRLKLFQLICEAVQHAHRNLIVHRDIKPGNILVTGDGVPKLLDFGIAKLLHPETSQLKWTQTMGTFPILTPDYASPEQIRGETVSTATDIYSLGIVLYELLTGRLPYNFGSSTPEQIGKIVSTAQPEKPSSLVNKNQKSLKISRQLAGDLDNIVLMALRKEPERRYSSVEQFSEDIRRHLEGRPVIASKDTIRYRVSKFVGRHKLGLSAVTMVILSLIAGIVAALYQARRADAEARVAERRFQQVRKLANTFLFDFHDGIRDLPGSTKTREMVAKTALEYLDNLTKEAGEDRSLQLELAIAYQKVGDVQGNPWAPNIGDVAGATRSYQKGLALAQKLADRERSNVEVLRTLAAGYFKLGALQSETGEKAKAGKTLTNALNVAETATRKFGEEKDLLLEGNILIRLGDVQLDTGDASSALQSYLRNQKLMEERAIGNPGNDAQNDVSLAYSHVGESQVALGELHNAIQNYQHCLDLIERVVKNERKNPRYLRTLRVCHTWVGHLSGNPLFLNLGDKTTATQHYRHAVAVAEEMVATDPKNARARLDLAIDYGNLGDSLSDSDPAKAAELHQNALGIINELLTASPNQFMFLRRKAQNLRGLADDLRNRNDLKGAIRALNESHETLKALSTMDPFNTLIQMEFHVTLSRLGSVLLSTNNSDGAMTHYKNALNIAEKSVATRPKDLYALWSLANSYQNIGGWYAVVATNPRTSIEKRIEFWRQALAWNQKYFNIWDSWPKRAPSTVFNTGRRSEAASAVVFCERELAKIQVTGRNW